MNQLLPHRFLFRYSFPVRHVAQVPRRGKSLLKLPAGCALPDFAELDSGKPFAEVRLAWNEAGLAIMAQVDGPPHNFDCRLNEPAESDGLQVWIDTRNTQNIHRAGRFCHHFCLMPAGGGSDGMQPTARQLTIARAREDAPAEHSNEIRVNRRDSAGSYAIEAWIPAAALNGFDPEAAPELGFYYLLRAGELGEQYLSVGPDFPIAHDPSLWSTIELQPK